MHIVNTLAGFEFENHAFFHEKVEPVFADQSSIIQNLDNLLPLTTKPSLSKLDHQRFLVNLLEKTRPQLPMHVDAAADYFLRERFFNEHNLMF